ncbi:MAG: hypothetical protein AAF349_02535 [Cyanobacteria bacterium P01_A01_bin.68]
MKKLLLGLVLVFVLALTSLPASADTPDLSIPKICTRQPGSSVNLRKGPGTKFEKGLAQVGSGGESVDDYWRKRGYTIQDGYKLTYVAKEKKGKDGRIWYEVGTNQWSAWVRSDFVCGKSGNLAGWEGSLFGAGEYPEDILLSSKDWDLLPVSGEEDVNSASMTFAITKSQEGDSLLVLYWSFGNLYFQVRVPGINGNGVQIQGVEEFIVDGKKQDTEKLSASELISLLRKGKNLVITENIPFKSQEYSLMGTYEVLKEVAKIADQLKLETE